MSDGQTRPTDYLRTRRRRDEKQIKSGNFVDNESDRYTVKWQWTNGDAEKVGDRSAGSNQGCVCVCARACTAVTSRLYTRSAILPVI